MFDRIDLQVVSEKIKSLEATIAKAKELVTTIKTFQGVGLGIASRRAALESELVSVKAVQKDNRNATKAAIRKLKDVI